MMTLPMRPQLHLHLDRHLQVLRPWRDNRPIIIILLPMLLLHQDIEQRHCKRSGIPYNLSLTATQDLLHPSILVIQCTVLLIRIVLLVWCHFTLAYPLQDHPMLLLRLREDSLQLRPFLLQVTTQSLHRCFISRKCYPRLRRLLR